MASEGPFEGKTGAPSAAGHCKCRGGPGKALRAEFQPNLLLKGLCSGALRPTSNPLALQEGFKLEEWTRGQEPADGVGWGHL